MRRHGFGGCGGVEEQLSAAPHTVVVVLLRSTDSEPIVDIVVRRWFRGSW